MFDWFKRKPAPFAATVAPTPEVPLQTVFTVTVAGPTGQGTQVQISETEIAERASAHAFVLTTDPATLKTSDQWWEEDSHQRRSRAGSDKAYAWLLPFMPLEVARLEQVQKASKWGPPCAVAIAKELRALIRDRRKAKQPHDALLRALYGTCVMADLSASLAFEGSQPRVLSKFVSLEELQSISCDFQVMGHECIESIGKTDAKWLVEAFGAPAEHQSFDAAYPHVRRNAIARYCWHEVQQLNEFTKALGRPQKGMQEWLHELVKRNIGYDKEWQERVAARAERLTEQSTGVADAWAATNQPFVVADLETTGLNAVTDEILEFAAVIVDPGGTVTAEFSVLVQAKQPVPAAITRLTGITQADVDDKGVPLAAAFAQFLAFIGGRPLFFHNAPFDIGFLKQATVLTKKKFASTVHDTLPMARAAWPALGSYRLSVLAEHVGAAASSHRGLADVKATLSVLLAARLQCGSPQAL
jgi:DNA polymerase-3 subunit epsilon